MKIVFSRAAVGLLFVVLVIGLLGSQTTAWAGVTRFEGLLTRQTRTIGYGLQVDRNLTATSTNNPLVYFLQDHASDDQALLKLKQDGSGNLLTCDYGATTNVFQLGMSGILTLAGAGTIDNTTSASILALTETTIALNGAITAHGITTFDGGLTAAAHVGKLHGAGASGAAFSLGAGAAGVKGMSYYLNSTSITDTHSLEGLYINVDYGVGATSPAPFGEAGRFRARLMGDSAMTVAGSHSTVEWGQAGASTSGLVAGSRSNLVFVDSTAGGGTLTGAQAELFSGGANTDLSGATASIMRLVIDGTVTASKFTVPVFDIVLPAALVADDIIMDTAASANVVGAKLRIRVNGTAYWIMLADASD